MDIFKFPPEDVFVFRRKLNETFSITLSEEADHDTAMREIFFSPNRIGILRLDDKRVKLCAHAHEALKIDL